MEDFDADGVRKQETLTLSMAAQGCSGIEGIGLDKGVVLVSLSRIVGATTNPG